jgi:hypothetical protein
MEVSGVEGPGSTPDSLDSSSGVMCVSEEAELEVFPVTSALSWAAKASSLSASADIAGTPSDDLAKEFNSFFK